MIPMPKSGKNSILFTPLNSVGVRLRAALKLKIANGIWQVRATPLHQPPNGFGRRLYCQQENPKGNRRRRIWISIGIILALLIIFHRPILLASIHWFAVRAAAKENLKLDFCLEGSVLGGITIRNLHITPLKPESPVESGDANYIRAEYDLFSLLGNKADLIELIEIRDAHFVIKPQPAVKPSPPPKEQTSLPGIFPQRVRIEGVSVTA